MNDSNHVARAYLSMIIEPGDTFIGRMLELVTPTEMVTELWRGAGDEHNKSYRQRMQFGADVEGAAAAWYARHVNRELSFLIPGDAKWPLGLNDLGRQMPVGLWVRR